jgi:hypothetical protein
MSNAFPFTVNGVSNDGTGPAPRLSTQLTLVMRVDDNASKDEPRRTTVTLDCTMDWANSTAPDDDKDILKGTSARARTRHLNTTITMDPQAPELVPWLFDRSGTSKPQAIVVEMEQRNQEQNRTWNLMECFPIRYDAGDYSPSSTTKVETIVVKIGHVELA